jgi:RNA polymerase-interacting CarD/CdnL/TRCF family regulator
MPKPSEREENRMWKKLEEEFRRDLKPREIMKSLEIYAKSLLYQIQYNKRLTYDEHCHAAADYVIMKALIVVLRKLYKTANKPT